MSDGDAMRVQTGSANGRAFSWRKGWPKGRPHPSRGSRHPWVGDWGNFSDGRSKLSCLARRIETEELASYRGDTPERARIKRQASRFLALVEMVSVQLGTEKNTPRRLTARQGSADRQLKRLDAIGARVPTATGNLASLVLDAHKDVQR